MKWWKEAVVYQIYPRSFYDSNDDGIGDIQGIIEKLDYLNDGTQASLGVDAIWLSPIHPSPMYDFGYDISDYNSIDPVFGDLEIFKEFIKQAHKRNIKILLDLVVNHTSHLHPWFVESRSSIDNPKRDWYIWKNGNGKNPPNNWLGVFGGRAWEYDEKTKQYYYHAFLKEQPDLNWRNPEVSKAIFDMVKYWLDFGVDGFRLDVVNIYIKDKEFKNNPVRWFKIGRPFDRQIHKYEGDQPELHDILKDFRKLLNGYEGKTSVGEIMVEPPGNAELVSTYYGKKNDELHMAFNFEFLFSKWDAESFQKNIQKWETALKDNKGWPTYTLSNHDFGRHISRYAKRKRTFKRAKIAALMLFTLKGTPFIYYGEEIGMRDQKIPKNRIQDPLGLRYWPLYKGRDVCRIPMSWNDDEFSGFSKKLSWLPVYNKYKKINTKNQIEQKYSLFNFYKHLIWFRKTNPILLEGTFSFIEHLPKGILGYKRECDSDSYAILLNFTDNEFLLEDYNNKKVLITTLKDDKNYLMEKFCLRANEGLLIDLRS